MTPYLSTLNDDQLHALNLAPTADGGYQIVWPADYNIYAATIGRFLGPDHRNRLAMIFEDSDGTVTRMSFAQIDAAATGLAAGLRDLGYG